MNWEENLEMKKEVKRIEGLLWKYFKGVLHSQNIDCADLTDEELTLKYPKQKVASKFALLLEVARRSNLKDSQAPIIFKEYYSEFLFVLGILTDDEMAYLCTPIVTFLLSEYAIDTPSTFVYANETVPQGLDTLFLSLIKDGSDNQNVLTINRDLHCDSKNFVVKALGLKELSLWNYNKDLNTLAISDLVNIDRLYAFIQILIFDLQNIHAAAFLSLANYEKETAMEIMNGHHEWMSTIDAMENIIYFASDLRSADEDFMLRRCFSQMKPEAKLIIVVNSNVLHRSFFWPNDDEAEEQTTLSMDEGLTSIIKGHFVQTVIDLPKGLWSETEDNTSILVASKDPKQRQNQEVLFVDATMCFDPENQHVFDYTSYLLASQQFKTIYHPDRSFNVKVYQTAGYIGWERIEEENGFLSSAYYLGRKSKDKIIYGDDAVILLESILDSFSFDKGLYSSTIVKAKLLDLISQNNIQIRTVDNMLNDGWEVLFTLSAEELTACDTEGTEYCNDYQVVISNRLIESNNFTFSLLSDTLQKYGKFPIYDFIRKIGYIRVKPTVYKSDFLEHSIYEMIGYISHSISRDVWNGIDDLISKIMPKRAHLFPPCEIAINKIGVLNPDYIEPEQFESYCQTEIGNGYFSKEFLGYRSDNSLENAFMCPLLGATFTDEKGQTKHVEPAILQRSIRYIKDNGRLLTLLPASFMSRSDTEFYSLRKKFTEDNLLDTVILLPKEIQERSNIPTCLLLLRKGRRELDPIRMIDASDCWREGVHSNELHVDKVMELLSKDNDPHVSITFMHEVIRDYYSWSPKHYSLNEQEIPKGYAALRFEDVATQIKGKKASKHTKGTVVQITDLKSNPFDYQLALDDASSISFAKYEFIPQCIEEPVLLLSSIRDLRPTFSSASLEEPIYLDSNIYAFRVKTDRVYLPYLVYYLSGIGKKLAQNQVIPRNSLLDIMSLKIVFPESIDAQKAVVKDAQKTYEQGLLKEHRLLETIQNMKAEYMNEVRMRKHDMMTPMTQMKTSFLLLKSILGQISGNDNLVDNIKIFLSRQEKALSDMSLQLQRLSDEATFGEAEIFDLETALSQIVPSSSVYRVLFKKDVRIFEEYSMTNALIKMAPVDFSSMVDNILSNALRHGFVDPQRTDYRIEIGLSIIDGMFVCTFTNNGLPLPEGMTVNRYGLLGEKAGINAGTGIGGHRIKSIVEHYGGSIDLKSVNCSDEPLTTIIVKLPIYLENEKV